MTTDATGPAGAEEMPAVCPQHPPSEYIGCAGCRADALVDGDAKAMAAWQARLQIARCDAEFPPRFRAARADHPQVLDWVEAWTRDRSGCPSLLLMGPVGTGKTWQAYGALRMAVTGPAPADWVATTCADMYASLRPRGPGYDTEAVMRRYQTAGLLLVDDLGAGKASEATEEALYRILNGRYEQCLPSVFTTNLPTDPAKAGPEGTLQHAIGDRLASRLAQTCTRVILTGPDRRRSAA